MSRSTPTSGSVNPAGNTRAGNSPAGNSPPRWASKQIALLALVTALAGVTALGCTSVTTVRLQPETVEVGPGMRPIAGIQSNAISAYLLFIPIPGGVDLDHVVNRLLVVTAKTMGADKITNLRFDITPENGLWILRKLLGFRSAQASGIAVQITAPAPDPWAESGPEAPPPATPGPEAAPPPATPGPDAPGPRAPGSQ